MPLPAPQALAALAGTPAGWGHHTSKTVICPHTSAQTVWRLAMSLGSWETFSVGWLQKCIFSLSTWLRMIYCLQTIHEPACVILTLFQFLIIVTIVPRSVFTKNSSIKLYKEDKSCYLILIPGPLLNKNLKCPVTYMLMMPGVFWSANGFLFGSTFLHWFELFLCIQWCLCSLFLFLGSRRDAWRVLLVQAVVAWQEGSVAWQEGKVFLDYPTTSV